MGSGVLIAISTFLLLFTTCDIGLGPIVNTEKPIIKNSGNNVPGAYLQGASNPIELDVSNKMGFKIEEVWMDIEYTDKVTKKKVTKRVYAEQDSTGKWSVNLDTTGMMDGRITGIVTAEDESGNRTTTTEMVFFVKNTPPQIEMTIPGIKGINFDNKYTKNGSDGFLDNLTDTDPIFVGFDLMGLATDDLGIAEGFPKIQFWRDGDMDVELSNGIPIDAKHAAWREMIRSNTGDNPTSTRITWPMVQLIEDSKAPGGYRQPQGSEPTTYLGHGNYCFRIWTRDLFGNDNYYPNRSDNTLGLDPNDPSYPYKSIKFNYMVSEIPIANVTDSPQYYNGIGAFPVTIRVSSTNPLAKLEIFLAANEQGDAQKGRTITITDREFTPMGSIYNFDNLDIKSYSEYDELSEWPTPIGNGYLYLHVVATDTSGKINPQAFKYFVFDTTPPAVKFTQPLNITKVDPTRNGTFANAGVYWEIYYPSTTDPKWVTGTITISGSASDPTKDNLDKSIPSSVIKEIKYHIGRANVNGSYKTEYGLTGQTLQDFYDAIPWVDTGLNSMRPADGWSGNVNTWFFTGNFNGWKKDAVKKDLVQEATEFGQSDTNGRDPVTIDKTGTDTRERFYLPFYVRVMDGANNIKIVHYKLCIDPDMDIPYVNITYPNDDDILGGEIRVSGTAADNNAIDKVLVRIQRADRPGEYYIPTINGAKLLPFYPNNTYYNTSAFLDPADDTLAKKNGWFEAFTIGSGAVVAWYIPINGDQGLDPPGVNPVEVKIEARAIDFKEDYSTPNLLGTIGSVDVEFSAEVPTITGAQVTKGSTVTPYAEGIRTSGTITISMNINDGKGFSNIRARFGSDPYTDIVRNGSIQVSLPAGWSATFKPVGPVPDASRPQFYKLEFVVDTTKPSIAAYGQTGTLVLDLDVSNITTPSPLKATAKYTLEIDNYFPTATITTTLAGSGSKFLLQGEAKDYPDGRDVLQGLERALVYFEKAKIVYDTASSTINTADIAKRKVVGTGAYFRPNGLTLNASEMTSLPANTIMDTTVGYTPGVTVIPQNAVGFKFPVLSKTGDTITSAQAMVIDSQELGENTDSDGDGTYGEVWDGLVDKSWGARFNSESFPDGPIMIHYIFTDKAGNSTHYQQALKIENLKPVIMSVNIGTDVNGDGIVTDYTDNDNPGEYIKEKTNVGGNQVANSKIAYTPTAFRVRGNRIAFDINALDGNLPKRYRVYYAIENPAVASTTMKMGDVYTIDTVTGDYKQYGALMNFPNITFVATGTPTETTGNVKSYTTTEIGAGNFIGNNAKIAIDTSLFPVITDSDKTNGEVTDHNKRYFIIKIYDSAVSNVENNSGSIITPAPEWEQLAHAILVAVDIDNNDGAPPTINSSPFGQEYILPTNNVGDDTAKTLGNLSNDNYIKNIVMSGDTKQGYVQYAYDGTGTILATAATVSGKVVFLGKAADNQRIQNIKVTIPGFDGGSGAGTAFTVANWSGGKLTSTRTTMGTGTSAWYFKILDDKLTLDYGHAINWEFAWDSSEVVNQSGLNVTFSVNDFRAGSPTAPTATRPINIVPYISEVVTRLSDAYDPPSAFARSANGWYPVRENEVITINGFNLGTNGTTTGVTIGGTALTYNAANPPTSGNFCIVGSGKNQILANVGTTATSGSLVVNVNSTPSHNNNNPRKFLNGTTDTPTNRVQYNWEPNGVNNNNLTINRYLYIWNTGYVINDTIMLNPFMRMANNGTRYVSFGRYGSDGTNNQGHLKVIVNNTGLNASAQPQFTNNDTGTAQGTVLYQTNRFINTTIGVSKEGDWATVASNITSGQSNLQLVYNQFGAGDGNSTTATGAAGMRRRIRNLTTDPYRSQIPRIVVQRTSDTAGARSIPARMVFSYYDATYTSNPIMIHYGACDGANNPGWTGNIPNAADQNPSTSLTDGTIVANNTTTKAKGGMYTAVGMLSTGRPVIAWYDSITDGGCLWFSYGPTPSGNTITTTTADWQSNAVKIASGYGTHVDLAVDSNNNVHLAYVNSSKGGLYYAYIPYVSATPSPSTAVTARVDTFLSTGQKLMINVRGNIPYISYIHNAFAESKNSIRVAWAKTAVAAVGDVKDGTNGNFFTGNWEVMTVPAEYIPSVSEFVCNGVPSGTNATLTQPSDSSLRTYNTLDKSMFVTYMTNKWYEGAVLKADLTTITY